MYDLGRSRSIHAPLWDEMLWNTGVGGLGSHFMIQSTMDESRFKSEMAELSFIFKEWVRPVVDLSEFDYCYATSGITESLTAWSLGEKRKINAFRGEYQWISHVGAVVHRIDDPCQYQDGVLYMSNPFSATGNFDPRWEEVVHRGIPAILDCAFVGSTPGGRIQIGETVEQVFFSLSKPFGLASLRAGLRFSRYPIGYLDTMLPVGYYHGGIPLWYGSIMKDYGVYDMGKRVRPFQEYICAKMGLSPSDSYLIGTGGGDKYDYWKRENGVNRICLTIPYMKEGLPGVRTPKEV